jgi:archaellum component FlaG (FlaF/FlaG flagellin family)
MKKKVIVLIGLLLLIFSHQFYWHSKLDGNLKFYISNMSTEEKDDIPKIEVFIDGDEIFSKDLKKGPANGKTISLNVYPGKHEVIVKTKGDQIVEKYEFYSFLIKRVVIEYQGKDNLLDDSKEFLIHSNSVFGSFAIQ